MNTNNTNNNANKRGCTGRFCKKLGNKARNLTKKVTNWFQTPAETQNGAAGVQKTLYRGRAGSNEYAREMERLHQAERQRYEQYAREMNAKRILTGEGMILPTWNQIQRREYRDPRLPPLPQPAYEAPVPFTPPVAPVAPVAPVPRVAKRPSTSVVYYNGNKGINELNRFRHRSISETNKELAKQWNGMRQRNPGYGGYGGSRKVRSGSRILGRKLKHKKTSKK
jgi:hypothetical protein